MRVYEEISRHERDVNFHFRLFLVLPISFSSFILARRATDIKAKNTFVLPEIIFNPFLIFSPHVAFLDLIFTDDTFLIPSLTSAERISELDIPPDYE